MWPHFLKKLVALNLKGIDYEYVPVNLLAKEQVNYFFIRVQFYLQSSAIF